MKKFKKRLSDEDLQKINDALFDGRIQLSYKFDTSGLDDDLQERIKQYRAEETIEKNRKRLKTLAILFTIVFALTVVAFGIYLTIGISSTIIHISNQGGNIKNVPIGNTVITMNYNTEMAYEQDTISKVLTVRLEDGEIALKNPGGDFIHVTSGNSSFSFISGTINFFSRKGFTSISSLDAEVSVNIEGKEYMLKPGQDITLPGSGPIRIKRFNSVPGAWTNERIISFNERPMKFILDELQERAKILIKIDPNDPLLDRLVSGSFSLDDPLEEILYRLVPEGGYTVQNPEPKVFLIINEKAVNPL